MNFKKKLLILLIVNFISLLNINICAETCIYEVYDAINPNEVEIFENYNSAYNFYNQMINEYENAVIKENDTVINMEYGIVEFIINEGCTLEINYHSISRNYEGSINACYGIDAAFINIDHNYIYFYLSGDYGYTNIENAILHPYEELNYAISKYRINNKILYHDIKTQLNNDFYSTSINLGEIKDIKDGEYYSYDGHYFYDDFHLMIDDYQNNLFENALNYERPYYNYYQYLSHRSLTNYTYQEIEDYFYQTLCFDKKLDSYIDHSRDNANDIVNRSQYYDELKSFFEYQNLYGSNALMMLSESINESAYGKSLSSYMKNNLFSHSAYETEIERKYSRYSFIETSIYSHSKNYISNSYSNHRKPSYYGSFFGNKVSGMNVMYSLDPYWGEKSAYNYYRLDKALGEKDKDAYCLGIIDNKKSLNIYRDETLRNIYYRMSNVNDFSFIILEELANAYLVQIDPSFNNDYLYDFEKSVAYINKNDINYLINEDKMKINEFVIINFDADGGKIANQEMINMKIRKGDIPIINSARKDGYKFIGFDTEITNANNSITYTAIYKKIDHLELINNIDTDIEYAGPYDLRDSKIKVIYDDQSEEIIEIDSQMIESYDTKLEAKQEINIIYCGLKIPIEINNSMELIEIKNNLQEKIDFNIKVNNLNNTYSKNDLKYIRENINKVDFIPSFKELRQLDKMLLKDFDKEIYINDEYYDMSISGLAFSNQDDSFSLFNLLKNTYYINVEKSSNEAYERLYEVASAYGFNIIDAININLSLNYQESKINGPVIIQLNIDDMQNDKIYSVYHLNKDNDVIKCRTTQTSNYIQFMTEELGDFMIMNLDSANNYIFEDESENISLDNDYFDNHGIVRDIMAFTFVSIIGFIMIVIYYIILNKKDREWNAYKKSLQVEDIVQEEKLKN